MENPGNYGKCHKFMEFLNFREFSVLDVISFREFSVLEKSQRMVTVRHSEGTVRAQWSQQCPNSGVNSVRTVVSTVVSSVVSFLCFSVTVLTLFWESPLKRASFWQICQNCQNRKITKTVVVHKRVHNGSITGHKTALFRQIVSKPRIGHGDVERMAKTVKTRVLVVLC